MYTNCLQNIKHCERQHNKALILGVSLSLMKQTNPFNHVMSITFIAFLFFILFSAIILSSKTNYFHFVSTLNEKTKLDFIVKIKIISQPETITDAVQTIRVTKGLAYDKTSSVTINFCNEFCDVPQKEKT